MIHACLLILGRSCSTACASFYADRLRAGVARGCGSYNGGDLTMRAIWINAVANLVVAYPPDSPDGFNGAALTHRH